MAEKDVLSQEEIDALLTTVDNEETETPAAGEEAPPQEEAAASSNGQTPPSAETAKEDGEQVEVLNFSSQERIVRGELPVLDKIHDRAARFFSNDIYQLMAKELQIKQDPLQIIKHRDYFGSLPNPTLMSTYRFKPLRGKALISFDNTFVYDLVDYYFGGSSQFLSQADKTDFTAAELRVMEIVFTKLVRNIELAWQPIIELEAQRAGDETNPQLVHIAEPEELLLISRFVVDFGRESGSFSFAMPYSMVEPIKQQLELGAARPDDEIDPNWIKSLKEELMDVELSVSCVMAHSNSTLGKVMAWKVNDFLPMEMQEIVTLDIEGTPSFTATVGTASDKRALKIIKKISY